MSRFERIGADHPLAEAARYVSAQAQEHGYEAATEWLNLGCTTSQFEYLAEQRALRVLRAMRGEDANPLKLEPIQMTAEEREVVELFAGCYLEGMAIGWKGRELKREEPA